MIKRFQNIRKNLTAAKSSILIMTIVMLISFIGCKKENGLPDPLEAGWNNQSVCEIVEDNPKIRVLKCTFTPGVGHERHYHAAHFGYTIKGSKFRIKDTTGTREVNVPTGTEFYNDGIEWHEILNIGDSTAVFFIIEPKN